MKERCILVCKKCGQEIKLNYNGTDIIGLIENGTLEYIPSMKLRRTNLGYMDLGLKHKKGDCGGTMKLSKTIKIRMKFEKEI